MKVWGRRSRLSKRVAGRTASWIVPFPAWLVCEKNPYAIDVRVRERKPWEMLAWLGNDCDLRRGGSCPAGKRGTALGNRHD